MIDQIQIVIEQTLKPFPIVFKENFIHQEMAMVSFYKVLHRNYQIVKQLHILGGHKKMIKYNSTDVSINDIKQHIDDYLKDGFAKKMEFLVESIKNRQFAKYDSQISFCDKGHEQILAYLKAGV